MSIIIDNVLAYKILKLLVTPFNQSDAYKLGIIDAKGKLLKKVKDFTTSAEKEAYSYLHRLVFNLKRLLNRLPGGDNYTKNLAAAYFLIKESLLTDVEDLEEQFNSLINVIESKNLTLVEEEILVAQFLEDMSGGEVSNVIPPAASDIDLPANNTANVATNPKPITKILRRKKQVQ